ncbi:type IX secretion system membrane protein PorP/SprF [Flavobacterium sp. LC2016-23]|uniref:PorP/SprF family type IX secretion system membrane protein n=1 Tax=Flavobacterium sp. LC2016-23 TaxID=2666330 RepID=UPI0012B07F71|nr:type IX secretion system membrane protein PorP/SprF [Flavobacterium sp. LC2016-23]MRX42059.1 type IX secretion system membrane protein PorP/SprF [Flavobacterium sp. LC2016-23]
MKKNIGITLVWLFLATLNVVGQQNSQYTQYMYNTAILNPAYVGTREALSITGLNRMQWIGLEGAPKSMTFAVSSPVSEKVGLGVSVIHNQVGPSNETLFSGDISYNIRLNYEYWLFFGLKANAALLNVDYTKLQEYNPNDPVFQNSISNDFSPNVGAGIYLMSKDTYVGISAPIVLDTKDFTPNKELLVQRRVHYYLMAGHVFNLSEDVKFKPALLTDFVKGSPLNLNVSANFLFFDKLTLGAAYRWDAAVSGLAGFQITKKLFAGYTYDADTMNLGNYNSGSHELFLRFDLPVRIIKDCSCSPTRFY